MLFFCHFADFWPRADWLCRINAIAVKARKKADISIGKRSGLAQDRGAGHPLSDMDKVKDTLRALVRISYDGRVHKSFRGPRAQERFENEVRVLRFLEERGCNFVPRLLDANLEQLTIITSNCGSRVEYLDQKRTEELFAELEQYGVRHDDPEMRNVTYRQTDGRFCLIDFEFASILPGFEQSGMENTPPVPNQSAHGPSK